ncbi:MAG TPA: aspartyl beta-hydroxylase [Caulobacteraceae bacterium]|nr:aspartyl beta-hydroxylase [Caulobacteraceae bacterium]
MRWLAESSDWPTFIARAAELAERAGVGLDADALAGLRRDDPAGVARFEPPPSAPPTAPEPGWLPMQVVAAEQGLAVDWLHFGDQPLRAPFFEFDVLRSLDRPFNSLFRFRTPLSTLSEWVGAVPGLQPSGLIFHMSRCGSTLVSQMLAASDANVVVSEAKPLDVALQVAAASPPESGGVNAFADMVAALGQVRHGASGYFLKLEPWHLLRLSLFLEVFPDVPWLFLYRDPIEVLASLAGESMSQLAPLGVLQSALGNVVAAGEPPAAEARFLGAVCEGAIEALQTRNSRGLAVNYAELPQAFETRILPHFAAAYRPDQLDLMRRAQAFDAKAPWQAFRPDGDAKRERAGDTLIALARTHLSRSYAALEALNPARA